LRNTWQPKTSLAASTQVSVAELKKPMILTVTLICDVLTLFAMHTSWSELP
jgi:hypothetical protein